MRARILSKSSYICSMVGISPASPKSLLVQYGNDTVEDLDSPDLYFKSAFVAELNLADLSLRVGTISNCSWRDFLSVLFLKSSCSSGLANGTLDLLSPMSFSLCSRPKCSSLTSETEPIAPSLPLLLLENKSSSS